MSTAADLLDGPLDIEEQFYREGLDLGVADGATAGYTEGSVFGVEKGFEKFFELGRLYGKALVWAQRAADSPAGAMGGTANAANAASTGSASSRTADAAPTDPSICKDMPRLARSARLAKNLSTLLELVDPASLAMQNTEEAVNDADERLKGAALKAKLIQRALGEREDAAAEHVRLDARDGRKTSGDGSGSIEDISSLSVRRLD